ncbi:MAG: IS4 family transposase [Bacteroidia bacterium]|nr:IS4 family transposase [Bacteroidia bacterium]
MAKFALDLDQVAQLLWSFLALEDKVVLILDRTNWKFGQKNINILMLSVAYQGVSVPLLWTLLNKKGSSSESERIALLARFVGLFGAKCIDHLLADREFIGKNWLVYLQEEQIAFIIRIRENALVDGKKGAKVKKLFAHLKLLQGYYYTKARRIYGIQVYVSARRSPKGLLIVMSSTFTGTAIKQYGRRWEIETMFKAFKTQGFQLEDSHITHLERFEKLLALIAIAFYWAYQSGIFKDKEIQAIQVSKSTLRKEYSFFNYGLEALREALLLAHYQIFTKFIRLLS